MMTDVFPPTPPAFDLAQNDAEQKKLALRFKTPYADREAARSMSIISSFGDIPKEALSHSQIRQLTKAYQRMGLFAKAYDVSGDEYYRRLAEAPEELCGCPDNDTYQIVDGKPVKLTFTHTYQRARTFKDRKPAGIFVCGKCGHLSVKCDDNS